MEQWKVLLQDRLPAYITWERYLRNRERIKQNRNQFGCQGAPRSGVALLAGVLVCGSCGRRMQPLYHAHGKAQYACSRQYLVATESRCPGLAARVVDDLVAQQVLRALEPAAVELSMRTQADVEQERRRLEKHWQQRRQRARYDVDLAERRYQAVDPENRLVAGILERRWEELLVQEKLLQEEHERFVHQRPSQLSTEERARLLALSSDIRVLWNARGTTHVDRKQILRCLVERVTVHVRNDNEFTAVIIQWAGGYESQHEIVRPVRRYEQLRDLEPLLDRAQELRQSGHTMNQIAEQLNSEGFHSPTCRGRIKAAMVNQLLQRRGTITDERGHDELLGPHEWWLADLADELKTSPNKLQEWVNRGWVHGRQTPVQSWLGSVGRRGRIAAASRAHRQEPPREKSSSHRTEDTEKTPRRNLMTANLPHECLIITWMGMFRSGTLAARGWGNGLCGNPDRGAAILSGLLVNTMALFPRFQLRFFNGIHLK